MYDVYVIGFGGGDVRGCQAVVRPNTSKPPPYHTRTKTAIKFTGHGLKQLTDKRPSTDLSLLLLWTKRSFNQKHSLYPCHCNSLLLLPTTYPPWAPNNPSNCQPAVVHPTKQPPPQQHPPAHRPGAFACRQKVYRRSFTRATSSASLDTRNNDADIAT